LGVLCPPSRLSGTLTVTHRFKDAFALIAPAEWAEVFQNLPRSGNKRHDWLLKQAWLLIDQSTNTGRQLHRWMERGGLKIDHAMQLDSFDLIVTLVSLGMGVSFVPMRALALYGRKTTLTRLPMKERFERELVVVMRRHRKRPAHLSEFVDNVLF
jgi:DNA-binding transcriptional LysR family regulator